MRDRAHARHWDQGFNTDPGEVLGMVVTPKVEMLVELHRLAEILGGPPTSTEMCERGEYSLGPYIRVFGSWNEALAAAGLEVNEEKNNPESDEELLDHLRALSDELGKVPTIQDMKEHGDFSRRPYENRFGSWNNALERVGLEPNLSHQDETITREKVIAQVRRLADELGRPPSERELRDSWEWSQKAYYHAGFQTWNGVILRSGLIPRATDMPSGKENPNYGGGGVELNYGPNWDSSREEAIQDAGEVCESCGMSREEHRDEYGKDFHVHHIRPRKEFDNDDEEQNALSNLVVVCSSCHPKWEGVPHRPGSSGEKAW